VTALDRMGFSSSDECHAQTVPLRRGFMMRTKPEVDLAGKRKAVAFSELGAFYPTRPWRRCRICACTTVVGFKARRAAVWQLMRA
jgi:hypothetical protein